MLLYGNKKETLSLQAPINPENIQVMPEEDDEEILPVIDAEIVEDVPPVVCEGCAQEITAINEEWTAEKIIENSKKKYKGKILCADCQRKLQEQAKKTKEAAGK
jgi:hypothetical protein